MIRRISDYRTDEVPKRTVNEYRHSCPSKELILSTPRKPRRNVLWWTAKYLPKCSTNHIYYKFIFQGGSTQVSDKAVQFQCCILNRNHFLGEVHITEFQWLDMFLKMTWKPKIQWRWILKTATRIVTFHMSCQVFERCIKSSRRSKDLFGEEFREAFIRTRLLEKELNQNLRQSPISKQAENPFIQKYSGWAGWVALELQLMDLLSAAKHNIIKYKQKLYQCTCVTLKNLIVIGKTACVHRRKMALFLAK